MGQTTGLFGPGRMSSKAGRVRLITIRGGGFGFCLRQIVTIQKGRTLRILASGEFQSLDKNR